MKELGWRIYGDDANSTHSHPHCIYKNQRDCCVENECTPAKVDTWQLLKRFAAVAQVRDNRGLE
jgi:hypothetical protein